MLKKHSVILVCLLFLAFLLAGCGQQTGANKQSGDTKQEQSSNQKVEKIVLRAVTPFQKNSPEHVGFWMFVEEVEKRLGDRIEIKYLGGQEVIPAFQQIEMLSKGSFDIGHLPGNYAENFLPVADTLHLSRLKPWEEREKGVYDTLRQEFEKALNVVYLGKTSGPGYLYHLYTNFEVKSLNDFKGKTIRVAPVYVPLIKALGAGSASIPPGEIYTAMERKTVDGFGWPSLGVLASGWAEVTKYRIDPGFYPVGMGFFINGNAWKKMPEDVRKELEKIMADTEKKAYDRYAELVDKETKGIQEKGMKILNLPPEEAERFVKLAFEEGWKQVIEKAPQLGPKLKELTTPKQ